MSDYKSGKKSNALPLVGKLEISPRRLLNVTSLMAASAVASTALPRTAASETPGELPTPEPPFKGQPTTHPLGGHP
jgi:hypothetical protein